MVRLVIKGCEFDPAQVKDVVFGDSFRMELDKAMELADAGVDVNTKIAGMAALILLFSVALTSPS